MFDSLEDLMEYSSEEVKSIIENLMGEKDFYVLEMAKALTIFTDKILEPLVLKSESVIALDLSKEAYGYDIKVIIEALLIMFGCSYNMAKASKHEEIIKLCEFIQAKPHLICIKLYEKFTEMEKQRERPSEHGITTH